MKFANNHPWKFRSWSQAYMIGLCQTIVVITVEVVNLAILNTNQTIMDIIMNFLALVIIADFDDYFFLTVAHEPLSKLIADGELETHKEGQTINLEALLKTQVTSSDGARFRLDENMLRPETKKSALNVILEDLTGEDAPPGDKKVEEEEDENELRPMEGEPDYIYIDYRTGRTCGNKVARGVYVFLRMFFASIWFYFIPFVSIYLSYAIPYRFIEAADSTVDPTVIVVPE